MAIERIVVGTQREKVRQSLEKTVGRPVPGPVVDSYVSWERDSEPMPAPVRTFLMPAANAIVERRRLAESSPSVAVATPARKPGWDEERSKRRHVLQRIVGWDKAIPAAVIDAAMTWQKGQPMPTPVVNFIRQSRKPDVSEPQVTKADLLALQRDIQQGEADRIRAFQSLLPDIKIDQPPNNVTVNTQLLTPEQFDQLSAMLERVLSRGGTSRFQYDDNGKLTGVVRE